ncbi:unnamed protein product [Larinioides sclopetarius]|uniref:Uncharacterized protein n=1 Tax=Larinioides sclopetarius TaxID=280406 RepID=A0AAV1Z2S1_9ARAC
MESTEIVLILAKLAKSERLHVESPDNDEREEPRWIPEFRGGSKCFEGIATGRAQISEVLETSHAARSSFGGVRTCSLRTEASVIPHTTGSVPGTVWTAVSGFAWNAATRVWRYVTRNYGVSVHVQVLPVNELLIRLRDPHRERLVDRMRNIMREYSVVDVNALADTIQQDSSLVLQIILKYLVEFLIEEMSLPVRIPVAEDSLEYSANS